MQFCTQRSRFHVGGVKASLWLRWSRKFVLQNVGRSEWVRSQNRPHFVTRTSCRGEATSTPWPFPHEMLNSERIPQTFFVAYCRIAPTASARREKTWISRARAINEQVIRCTSPARGQSTLEKWRSAKGVMTTCFPSSDEQSTLSPKHSSRPRYMIDLLAVILMPISV